MSGLEKTRRGRLTGRTLLTDGLETNSLVANRQPLIGEVSNEGFQSRPSLLQARGGKGVSVDINASKKNPNKAECRDLELDLRIVRKKIKSLEKKISIIEERIKINEQKIEELISKISQLNILILIAGEVAPIAGMPGVVAGGTAIVALKIDRDELKKERDRLREDLKNLKKELEMQQDKLKRAELSKAEIIKIMQQLECN